MLSKILQKNGKNTVEPTNSEHVFIVFYLTIYNGYGKNINQFQPKNPLSKVKIVGTYIFIKINSGQMAKLAYALGLGPSS